MVRWRRRGRMRWLGRRSRVMLWRCFPIIPCAGCWTIWRPMWWRGSTDQARRRYPPVGVGGVQAVGGGAGFGGGGEQAETGGPRTLHAGQEAAALHGDGGFDGVPTPAVFRALAYKTNPPLPEPPRFADATALAAWLTDQRNDLEPPAITLAPVIATVKTAIAVQSGCLLARMSGSGATCFGLFATAAETRAAANSLNAAHPDWWITPSRLIS